MRELKTDEREILEHVVEDADAWWDHVQTSNPDKAELWLNNKLAKHQPSHETALAAADPQPIMGKDEDGNEIEIAPATVAIPYRNRAERDADDKAAEEARITPLMKWQAEMNQADRTEIPRWGEDLAQAVVDAGSTLPAELKAKVDAKAALRATKPEGAE